MAHWEKMAAQNNDQTHIRDTIIWLITVTLWLFNIAMENGSFIDGLPIKKWWFSMAMLNNQRVIDNLNLDSAIENEKAKV